jgi:hypothetical protein
MSLEADWENDWIDLGVRGRNRWKKCTRGGDGSLGRFRIKCLSFIQQFVVAHCTEKLLTNVVSKRMMQRKTVAENTWLQKHRHAESVMGELAEKLWRKKPIDLAGAALRRHSAPRTRQILSGS